MIPTQTLALSASWVCIWVARGPYLSPSSCAPGMMISPTSAPLAELRAGLTVQLARYQWLLLVGEPLLRQPRALSVHWWREGGVRKQ